MSMLNITVDSFGQTIRVSLTQDTVVFDASSFTDITYMFKPPGLDVVEKTAAFYTDGADGICTYTILDGLFTVAGEWVLWVLLEKTGASIPSVEGTFTVAHTY